MAKKFIQGNFKPTYPEKYLGDVSKIVFRSSWEYEMNKFFDNNKMIIKWSSEPIAIQYIKPTDGKIHRYFPDYYVEYIDNLGRLRKKILEIKPSSQTRQSISKKSKTALYENMTYAINVAKWEACKKFCDKHGLEFEIITEKSALK